MGDVRVGYVGRGGEGGMTVADRADTGLNGGVMSITVLG